MPMNDSAPCMLHPIRRDSLVGGRDSIMASGIGGSVIQVWFWNRLLKIRGAGEPSLEEELSDCLLLKIGDRVTGPSSLVGTTRRAAKMVTLDLDHPDIEEYMIQE